jgi:hypothetical protein
MRLMQQLPWTVMARLSCKLAFEVAEATLFSRYCNRT